MKISNGIVKRISLILYKHLKDYQEDMERAYCSSDDAFDVTLKVKFSPEGSGIQIKTSISFVAEKIQDSASEFIDESQRKLFDSIEDLRPKKGDGIDSITLSCGGTSAVLEAENE